MSEQFSVQMKEVLDGFSIELKSRVESAADKVSKNTAKRLKQTSPKKTGDYARGWSRKKIEGGYVVYNRTKPRLTHLLEYGHALANQFGSLGRRVAAHPHIKPAEQEGIKEFEELFK